MRLFNPQMFNPVMFNTLDQVEIKIMTIGMRMGAPALSARARQPSVGVSFQVPAVGITKKRQTVEVA